MSGAPIHIRPTAELAERVLLPGDPGRALALAQGLLDEPRMFNHHRGLWGYTGAAPDGRPLTIQSTGMGGPSAAIVVHELLELGMGRAIRVGTCGALAPSLALGDLLVASEALSADGTSRALEGAERVSADRRLTDALRAQAPSVIAGTVVSTDLFYDPDESRTATWRAQEALAVEMEAATLFALGRLRGAPMACVLLVSDVVDQEASRIDESLLAEGAQKMGRLAIAALAAP